MARLVLVAALAGLAGLGFVQPARAWPLDAADCKVLKAESDKLAAEGILADLKQGPDWAKANASAERIEKATRYLELQGSLLFRCPGQRAKATPAAKPPGTKVPGTKAPGTGKPAKKRTSSSADDELTTGTTTPVTAR